MPSILHRAFNAMTTGRPGPVSIDIPLDLQVATTEIEVQDLERRLPKGRIRADARALDDALALLLEAERPCIVAGGGVLTAEAAPELKAFAERLDIPVAFTWNGKGAFPEDHPLCAGPLGVGGSRAANETSADADVLLALGCRFTDWTSSSFRKGVTYAIPPTRLIHVDIDPATIGRSYPTEVGIVADIRAALEDLLAGVSEDQARKARDRRGPCLDRLAGRKRRWEEALEARRRFPGIPGSMLAVLAELRRALPRHGIVTVGSGHCQGAVRQGFPIFEPRTHLTSGGYSSMGFAVPAAMSAKLARPDAPVVAILGDGDMLMSIHELATCVMNDLPVVFLVLNNAGFMSIRDGQDALFDRNLGSAFHRTRAAVAQPYSPDFVGLGRSFGLDFAERVGDLRDLGSILERSLAHDGPALVEAPITGDPALAGAEPAGWWDFPPGPSASPEVWADYRAGRAAEQHLGDDTRGVELRPPLGIYG